MLENSKDSEAALGTSTFWTEEEENRILDLKSENGDSQVVEEEWNTWQAKPC